MSSTLHDILGKTKAEGPSSAQQQSSDDGKLKRKEQIQEEDAPSKPVFCGQKHSHHKQLDLDL